MSQALGKATGAAPSAPIPYARTSALQPFIDYGAELGVPIESWGRRAGLPLSQLACPESLLPLHACYRFVDLLVTETGQPAIGLAVATRASPFALGSLGTALRSANTVLAYVRIGRRMITSCSNSGIDLSYAIEDDLLRVNQYVIAGRGWGPAVADSYTLALTLNTLRSFLGDNWSPVEIRVRGADGLAEAFAAAWPRAAVSGDAAHSSFTLPLAQLARPIMPPAGVSRGAVDADGLVAMPDSFLESIERLIAICLQEGSADIDTVAASAGMGVRALQRRLEANGASFRSLLTKCRDDFARRLLTSTEWSIGMIASELGYTDASNFARAFGRLHGMSPAAFRRMASSA